MAKTKTATVQIHQFEGKTNRFFAAAKDPRGLTREYLILNAKDFEYELLRRKNLPGQVKGDFKEKGSREGTLNLIEVGEAVIDPIGKSRE